MDFNDFEQDNQFNMETQSQISIYSKINLEDIPDYEEKLLFGESKNYWERVRD